MEEKDIRQLIKSLKELIAVLENTIALKQSHDELVEAVNKMLTDRNTGSQN